MNVTLPFVISPHIKHAREVNSLPQSVNELCHFQFRMLLLPLSWGFFNQLECRSETKKNYFDKNVSLVGWFIHLSSKQTNPTHIPAKEICSVSLHAWNWLTKTKMELVGRGGDCNELYR